MIPNRRLRSRRMMHVTRGLVISALLLAVGGCARDPEVRKQQHFESGNKYLQQGQYSHAVIEYRNAIALDPKFGPAHRALGDAYTQLGDGRGALDGYVRAADLLPSDVDVQVNAGTLLLGAGRTREAVARADAALAVEPNNVQAHVLRGSALAGMTSFDEALDTMEQALLLDPGRGRTYASLGLIKLAQGRRDEAEKALQRAAEVSPNDVQVQVTLGSFFWTVGRTADAEQAFRAALKVEPDALAPNRFMAALLFSTDRQSEAEPFFRRIADLSSDSSGRLALADYYRAVGRPLDAIARLKTMPADGPGAREVAMRLAHAHADTGELAEARSLTDKLIAADPRDAGAQLLKSRLLLLEGRQAEAVAAANSAAAADPSSVEAEYALGRLHASRGDAEAAEAAFREVLRLDPASTDALLELAALQAVMGRAQESVKTAETATRSAPARLEARLVLVRNLITARELTRAETELRGLEADHPDNAAVHLQRGLLSILQGDRGTAQRALDRAESLKPGALDILGGFLALDLHRGDFDSVRARLSARLGRDASTDLLVLAARTYITMKDLPAAEGVLRRAIDTSPSLIEPYALLGQIYLTQGSLDRALKEFDAVAARQARPVGAHTMAGMILEQQGNQAQAIRRYEQALEIDPNAASAANNLAWVLAQSDGDLDRALALAQTAVAAAPDVPQVTDTLGWVYYKKGLSRSAIQQFSRSIELEPNNGWYHYHLGLAYRQAGEEASALASLRRALQAEGLDQKTAQEIRKLTVTR